tara:strand:+ start:336 stop:536 length:201 start_codon:yes stop_codon:yes gene_type:complete
MPSRKIAVGRLRDELESILGKIRWLYHEDDSFDVFADRVDEMETSEIIHVREIIKEVNALLPKRGF